MESFIGQVVEQSNCKIYLHLDAYIRETLDIYQAHQATKTLTPKSMQMHAGNVLTAEGVPEIPERCERHSIVRW